jgi:hypothetical protein
MPSAPARLKRRVAAPVAATFSRYHEAIASKWIAKGEGADPDHEGGHEAGVAPERQGAELVPELCPLLAVEVRLRLLLAGEELPPDDRLPPQPLAHLLEAGELLVPGDPSRNRVGPPVEVLGDHGHSAPVEAGLQVVQQLLRFSMRRRSKTRSHSARRPSADPLR